MFRTGSTTTAQRGVLLALGAAVISGLSIYLNAFGVKLVSDAAVYTTAKNGVAAVILVGGALMLGGAREARTLDRRHRVGLVAIAVIGGSIPFVLFFSGLAVATAPTAAFIQKTLFIWVALMAAPFLGERLGLVQVAARRAPRRPGPHRTANGDGLGAGRDHDRRCDAALVGRDRGREAPPRRGFGSVARGGTNGAWVRPAPRLSRGDRPPGWPRVDQGRRAGLGPRHRRPSRRLRGHLVRRAAAVRRRRP